ncbi:MAG TPA: hypothetical protein PK993_03680 [Clostridia bacterium]|nr:hypothetical protein [Clostridia bacterium]
MPFDYTRFKEYLIGKYYIITGKNSDLWALMPILYSYGFNIIYKNQIIILDLANLEA